MISKFKLTLKYFVQIVISEDQHLLIQNLVLKYNIILELLIEIVLIIF